MNLSNAHTTFPQGGDSGAGGSLGAAANAGPAHSLPPHIADEVMDQMAESIVDLARKLEESEARVAVLEEEQLILKRKFAGVIEGGQRHCDSEAYARPSDLSPRTTLPAHILREFIRGDDGEAIYWPTCDHGAYPAHLLRDIAAHLDRLNKEASQ